MPTWRAALPRVVVFVLFAVTGFLPGELGHAATLAPRAADACQSLPLTNVDRPYAVSGRVRLLLFWTGLREVGDARITWTGATSGQRGFELLIGTDPDRAPRRLNRWGYEAEKLCDDGSATLLGVMTQADEQTVDEATTTIAQDPAGGHPFKAVRATIDGAQSNTELFRLSLRDNLTYHNLDAVLARLPPPGTPLRMPMPPDADAGFLASVAAVLHDTVADYRGGRDIREPRERRYIYAGRLYALAQRRARALDSLSLGATTYRRLINGEFEIRNLTTRETTEFQVDYGTAEPLSEVPIRIQYHPRWWLALDLTLRTQP